MGAPLSLALGLDPWDRGGPSTARQVMCNIAERGALQRSEESVRALALSFSISPTTVQKWRKRTSITDRPMGPVEPRSTVLSIEQEAMIVAFGRHTLLPLDDCLYSLQATIPGLTRSSVLHGRPYTDAYNAIAFPGYLICWR